LIIVARISVMLELLVTRLAWQIQEKALAHASSSDERRMPSPVGLLNNDWRMSEYLILLWRKACQEVA
jgi:hypothetical protein